MRILCIICCCLLLGSCSNKPKENAKLPVDIMDTAFLKTIRWDTLNTYAAYHIINSGVQTSDTNIHYWIKPVAVLQHSTHTYRYTSDEIDLLKQDTPIDIKSTELKDIIRNDTFANRRSFDCLFRVNSEVFYKVKPYALRYVSIRPKDNKDTISLMNDLRKEIYTEKVNTEVLKNDSLPHIREDTISAVFIKIQLRPDYRDLTKIKGICARLKMRKDIKDAFFMDLWTGLNEMDVFYRITTRE